MPEPIKILLILDPEYSGALTESGCEAKVWILDTEYNRMRVEEFCIKYRSAERPTLFKAPSPLNKQTCMQLFETIDGHYEDNLEGVRVGFLKIIGSEKDEFWREALMTLGWTSLEKGPNWSSFKRKSLSI